MYIIHRDVLSVSKRLFFLTPLDTHVVVLNAAASLTSSLRGSSQGFLSEPYSPNTGFIA